MKIKPRVNTRTWFHDSKRRKIACGLRCFWIVLAAVTAAVFFWEVESLQFGLGFVWATLPPVYFFFEYHLLFDNKNDSVAVSEFLTSQDLASKIWAGLGALIAYKLFNP